MESKESDKSAGASNSQDYATSLEMGDVEPTEYANGNPSGPSKQLHRTFNARHIQMIGLAGSIGSGLFIGTGKVRDTLKPVTLRCKKLYTNT